MYNKTEVSLIVLGTIVTTWLGAHCLDHIIEGTAGLLHIWGFGTCTLLLGYVAGCLSANK